MKDVCSHGVAWEDKCVGCKLVNMQIELAEAKRVIIKVSKTLDIIQEELKNENTRIINNSIPSTLTSPSKEDR